MYPTPPSSGLVVL